MTKAAVAQQVRALEQEIGALLVERAGRGLALTDAGLAGAAGLAEGFALARPRRPRDARGQGPAVPGDQFDARPSPRPGSSRASAASRPAIPTSTCCSTPIPIDDALDRPTTDALIRWGAGDFPGLATTPPLQGRRLSRLRAGACRRASRRSARPRTSPGARSSTSNGARPIRPGRPGRTGSRRRARRQVDAGHGVWFNNMAHGDPGRGAGAGRGALLLRHRRRRPRGRAPRRALLDARQHALRLLLLLPPGGIRRRRASRPCASSSSRRRRPRRPSRGRGAGAPLASPVAARGPSFRRAIFRVVSNPSARDAARRRTGGRTWTWAND